MSVIKDAAGALTLALVVKFLSKTEDKAPESTVTPLITTTPDTQTSVFANPTGFLSGIKDIDFLFNAPTVKGLKSVADPFYNPDFVSGPTGPMSYYDTSLVPANLFGGGQIGAGGTLPQSFELDLSGVDFTSYLPTTVNRTAEDFAAGRF